MKNIIWAILSMLIVISCVSNQINEKVRSPAANELNCEEQLRNSQGTVLPNNVLKDCFEEALNIQKGIGFKSSTGIPSDADKEIVADYVDTWAYLINKALRTNDYKYNKKNESKLNRLDKGLARFPVYTGVVFRGSTFPSAPKLERGYVFTDLAFVSTSLDLSIADHYAGANGYITIILSKTGRSLSYDKSTEELSAEKEILFPRGRTFKVFDFRVDPKSNTNLVFLIEL